MTVIELSPETLAQAKEASMLDIIEATQNYDHWDRQVAVLKEDLAVLKEDLKEAKENLEIAKERLLALLWTFAARHSRV